MRRRRQPSKRQIHDKDHNVEIARVHRENYSVDGAREIWLHCHREGIGVARRTAERLMGDISASREPVTAGPSAPRSPIRRRASGQAGAETSSAEASVHVRGPQRSSVSTPASMPRSAQPATDTTTCSQNRSTDTNELIRTQGLLRATDHVEIRHPRMGRLVQSHPTACATGPPGPATRTIPGADCSRAVSRRSSRRLRNLTVDSTNSGIPSSANTTGSIIDPVPQWPALSRTPPNDNVPA